MSRHPRIEFPGAHHHVMSRGNAKQDIFLKRRDRSVFLQILGRVVSEHGWECYAYCLMNNHYHLVVHTPSPSLAIGMKYLNGVYSQGFNVRHDRVGHLFQGRYASRLVESDSHVLALMRYVVQNPLRAGLCKSLDGWGWTSFQATAGMSPCPSFLQPDFLLNMFSDYPRLAREAYQDFVSVPAVEEPWMKFAPVRNRCKGIEERLELPSIIQTTDDKDRRNLQIVDAFLDHGYTMAEIAAFLGCHPSNISKIVKKTVGMQNSCQGV